MTEQPYDAEATAPYVESEPLPVEVIVSEAFSKRLPSQRTIDTLLAAAPDVTLSEIANTQPFRLTAFRALLRQFPTRDPASLWAHAYDVEVQVADAVDPTNGNSTTPAPPLFTTGT